MGDWSSPSITPFCATKGSLANINYGDPNNPYTGRISVFEDIDGWAPLMEHGIYKNGTNSYYNVPTVVYRFSLKAVYIPIGPKGDIKGSIVSAKIEIFICCLRFKMLIL